VKNGQPDVRAIDEIRRRIEAAENTGDTAGIADLLADDAVIMAPSQPVQQGKAACAAFVAGVIARLLHHFDRHISYSSDEVRIIDDFAFDRGTFRFTVAPKSGGPSSLETGKYLFLLARSRDSVWRIARAIVSLDDADTESRN